MVPPKLCESAHHRRDTTSGINSNSVVESWFLFYCICFLQLTPVSRNGTANVLWECLALVRRHSTGYGRAGLQGWPQKPHTLLFKLNLGAPALYSGGCFLTDPWEAVVTRPSTEGSQSDIWMLSWLR